MQAETILNYQNSIDIPRISHKKIPDNSCYDIPTLKDYLRYRMLQKYVR